MSERREQLSRAREAAEAKPSKDVVELLKRIALDDTDPYRAHKKDIMRNFAARVPRDERAVVLDVGCGAGADLALLRAYLPEGTRLVGVDKMGASIAAARELHPFADFVQADVLELPVAEGEAHAVFASRLLTYCQDLELSLTSMVSALKPGGVGLLCDEDARTMQVLCGVDGVARAAAARASVIESAVPQPFAALKARSALLRRPDVRDVKLEARTVVVFDTHRPAGTDEITVNTDAQLLTQAVKRGALAEKDAGSYLATIRREVGTPSMIQIATLLQVSFTKA